MENIVAVIAVAFVAGIVVCRLYLNIKSRKAIADQFGLKWTDSKITCYLYYARWLHAFAKRYGRTPDRQEIKNKFGSSLDWLFYAN